MKILSALKQFWVPLLASFIAVLAMSLLFNDHFLVRLFVKIPSNIQIVGTTQRANGSVQRQSYFLPIWLGLYKADRLFDGDRIFTEAESGALITLMETVDVNLSANTLIEISVEDGLPKLLVEQGATDIKFLKHGAFLFEINGKMDLFAGEEGTELKIYFDEKTGFAQIQMLAGKGRLNDSTDVAEGDDLKLKKDGSVEKILNHLDSVAPEQESILIEPGSRVEFRWKTEGNIKAVKLTITTDDEKPQTLLDQSILNKQFWFTFRFPGEYSWTIATDKLDSSVKSLSKHLQVRFTDRPLLVYPRNGFKVDLGKLKLKAAVANLTDEEARKENKIKPIDVSSIPIRWVDIPGQAGFLVQTSDDGEFKSVSVHEVNGESSNGMSEDHLSLKKGTIFVRVARKPQAGKTPIWSPITGIEVEDTFDRKLASKAGGDSNVQNSYPYPKLSSVVFLQAGSTLQLKPKAKCTSSCLLQASVDGATREVNFNPGDSPEIKIDLDPSREGDVTWKLVDGEESIVGNFECRAYTKANLDLAVRERKSMEVLK